MDSPFAPDPTPRVRTFSAATESSRRDPLTYDATMAGKAFPVIYTEDVPRLAAFYGSLGFEIVYRFPPDDEAGYVSMQRGECTLGVVTIDSPKHLIGIDVGSGPRFEMFVYVDDLDACVERLRSDGTKVFSEPQDMPWGERLSYVADPDGNPVALSQEAG